MLTYDIVIKLGRIRPSVTAKEVNIHELINLHGRGYRMNRPTSGRSYKVVGVIKQQTNQ